MMCVFAEVIVGTLAGTAIGLILFAILNYFLGDI